MLVSCDSCFVTCGVQIVHSILWNVIRNQSQIWRMHSVLHLIFVYYSFSTGHPTSFKCPKCLVVAFHQNWQTVARETASWNMVSPSKPTTKEYLYVQQTRKLLPNHWISKATNQDEHDQNISSLVQQNAFLNNLLKFERQTLHYSYQTHRESGKDMLINRRLVTKTKIMNLKNDK